MSYQPTVLELYVWEQAVAAALFHPYSTYGILLVGTVLMAMAVLQRPRLSSWLTGLPTPVKIAITVFCMLEVVPAFVAAFGVWALVGYGYGGRIGRSVISLGGLFPGALERIGHAVGALAGGLWGFTAGFVAMEALAGLIGATATLILLKAVNFLRRGV